MLIASLFTILSLSFKLSVLPSTSPAALRPASMPALLTTSTVRDSADGFALALTARHVLAAGAPSAPAHAVKGPARLPDAVDVILQSNLVITIAAKHSSLSVDPRTLQNSAIVRHLLNYFAVVGPGLPSPLSSSLHRPHAR